MTVADCAALVERGDPGRFAATMAAPPAARDRLWPLYAFNLELARIPWAVAEPALAEMRLQWWIDTLADPPATTPHEVAAPLFELMRQGPIPAALLVGMAEARRADCWREPFAGQAALWAYLDATAGNLMWAAALALGADAPAEPVVRGFAQGAGLATWLQAAPALDAQGRQPLPDPAPAAVAALAREGLARIAVARARRHLLARAAIPALWPGWQARGILAQASADPARVMAGALALPPFRERGGLLVRAMTGFW